MNALLAGVEWFWREHPIITIFATITVAVLTVAVGLVMLNEIIEYARNLK